MKPMIKLPFLESLKRTYLYVFANFVQFLKPMSFWMVFLPLADICLRELSEHQIINKSWSSNSFMIFSMIASISLSVSVLRLIIRKETYSWLYVSLQQREFKYLMYNLGLLAVLILGMLISGSLLLGIATIFVPENLQTLTQNTSVLGIYMVLVLIVTAYVARMSIILAAIAVDDTEIGLHKAFTLTQGNTTKIFLGIVFSVLPVVLCSVFLGVWRQITNDETIVMNILGSVLTVIFSLMNSVFKSCYLAHVYQYFVFYDKHHSTEEK